MWWNTVLEIHLSCEGEHKILSVNTIYILEALACTNMAYCVISSVDSSQRWIKSWGVCVVHIAYSRVWQIGEDFTPQSVCPRGEKATTTVIDVFSPHSLSVRAKRQPCSNMYMYREEVIQVYSTLFKADQVVGRLKKIKKLIIHVYFMLKLWVALMKHNSTLVKIIHVWWNMLALILFHSLGHI